MKKYFLGVIILAATFAHAADQDKSPKPIQINYGFTRDYIANKNATFFKLEYNDRVIKQSGTKPNPLELDSSDNIHAKDDKDGISLAFRRGVGSLTGNLIDGLALQPFKLPWANAKDVMVSGGIHLSLENSRRIEADLGLQFRALHIANHAGITNWATIGAEHASASYGGGTGSLDSDILTFRAFAAKSFIHVTKQAMFDAKKAAMKELDDHAKTYNDAKKYLADIKDSDPESKKELGNIFEQYNDANVETRGNWYDYASKYLNGLLRQYYDVSRVQLFAEAQGQYSLSKTVEFRRYNSLWAAGFSVDLSPNVDKTTFIDIRYENGYLRADPSKANCALLISLGLRF